MKRIALALWICLFGAGVAMGQGPYGPGAGPATDVLGAHLLYGRGCPGCHAPHSGALGNGLAVTKDPNTGNVALWGEDASTLFGVTIQTGNTGTQTFSETLPASWMAGTPDVLGLLTCLTCHDGNTAKGPMMKGVLYETVPPKIYGTNPIPTFIGTNGYQNDHPVGLNATIGCGGGGDNWDCVNTAGVISWPAGSKMAQFVQNYGFFVQPQAYGGQATVQCTTCHNQHVMNVVSVTNGPNSGLATANYYTMFFIRAPYNPATDNPLANQTAQFCRQCHAGESNEVNGGTAGTVF